MQIDARYARAIEATAELLSKLRLEFTFVGNVARVAWLGGMVDSGSVDVIALMQPQQKNQVAMMASNRGFRVEREEIEQSEELDLIPLHFEGLRVHVLVASNALYAKMIGASRTVGSLKVAAPEDLALMLRLSEQHEAVGQLMAAPDFDRAGYNDRLVSIGLREFVIPSGARDPLREGEGDSSPSDAARNDKP